MIKIPDNVLKHFSDSVDLFKAWGDYFNHYRAVNFGVKKDYDTALSLDEKAVKLHNAIKAEIFKYAGMPSDSVISETVWANSPQFKWAAFAVVNALVDMVIPDVVADGYGRFSEIRNIGYGDSAVFDIKSSDLFYVTKNGNNRRHVTAQKQFTGQVALIPQNNSITVQVDLYRILAGKENLAEYAMKVALSIEAEIAKDIYTALSSSYNSLTANFKEAGFTQDGFIKLRNRVSAANGGGRVYVYGTDLALSEILPASDYMKMGVGETYTNIGYLPVFMNTSLIAFPQKIDWTSEDYEFAISDNELFFIASNSQSLVKIVFEGNTITIGDNLYDNANLTQEVTLHKRWAVGVVTNSKYGIMKLA